MPLTTRQKIKIASLMYQAVSAAERMSGATADIIEVRRNGINWRLDLREGIDFHFSPGSFRVADGAGLFAAHRLTSHGARDRHPYAPFRAMRGIAGPRICV